MKILLPITCLTRSPSLVRLGLALAMPFAPAALAIPPLHQISPALYLTEHCLFVIDASVTWSNPTTAYNDIYAPGPTAPYFPKLHGYFDQLIANCPGSYFSVCYIANTGASTAPNYIDRTYKADGINETYTAGTPFTYPTVDLCRYNLPGGSVIAPVLAVFDHELGHAWGARAFYNLTPPSLSDGHWLANSTVDGQMSSPSSPDGGVTVNKLYGDPIAGFHWQGVDNARNNDYATFSDQTLYLLGARETWPAAYVLNNAVYNSDHTAGYSTVDTFDQTGIVAAYGPRTPDYQTAQKRFKIGFVYIARDVAEVNTVFQNVEESAAAFCAGEGFDPISSRAQTPFLVDTKYRASVDAMLADLDGNVSPTLTVTDPYVTSIDGNAVINFTTADPDGPAPAVSVVPASTCATVAGSTVQITGLPDGVHFFTVKAVDAGGKKTFGHFTVEVHRPTSSTLISSQPVRQTATAGNPATFSVTATGTPTSFSYQWFRQSTHTSTWNSLTDGGAYSGATTATLTVAAGTPMDGDEFLCVVCNVTGTATSQAAKLVVTETPPVLTLQPMDIAVNSISSAAFTVAAASGPATFGYFHYEWQISTDGGSHWTDLANGPPYTGCTTASFHVAAALAMSGHQFRCQVGNTAGVATSQVATLTVGAVPAVITQPQPISLTVSVGQNPSFSVIASGTGPLSYLWSQYSTPVAGGTAPTLNLTSVHGSDAGAYTVYITNDYGSTRSNPCFLTVTPAGTGTAVGDLNGDGKSDVLLTNSATGDRAVWLMNGTTISAGSSVGALPTPWVFSGTGDFNGDGRHDIFLTNTSTGERAVWLMNGATIMSGGSLGVLPLAWVISGVGDFDGNGTGDVFLTNTATGERAIWLMNGTTISGGASLGILPINWVVNVTGDFNGDGKCDLVLTHSGTAERVIWLMNGTTISAGASLGVLSPVWSLAATGDFNGDGKSDLLLSNSFTGERAIWLMNGTTLTSGTSLGILPTMWALSRTGDFDGDGKSDIFLTNTSTGERVIWLMNGATIASAGSLGVLPITWVIAN